MANRRMINLSDFRSVEYNTLSIRQRYLFCGIVLFADDDGIMPVRFVRSLVFPLDEDLSIDDVVEDLKQLEAYSFIILYEKEEYLQVCDWWGRQFIDIKQYRQTKYPFPPNYEIRPKNLKKYSMNNEYSRRLLEQNREEESSEDEVRPYQDSSEGKEIPEYPLSE